MNKNLFRSGMLFLCLFLSQIVTAQQTDFYQNPGKTYRRAIALYNQSDFVAAGELFKKVLKTTPESHGDRVEDANYYIAECALKNHQKDAEFRLLNYINIYPESSRIPTVQFNLGELYFARRRYSRALQLFNKVLPKHLNRRQRLSYFYKKGYCLMKRNKTDEALHLFQKVINSRSPYAQPAGYFTAHIHYQMGNYDEALKAFLALKDDPRYRKYVPEYLIHIYYQQKQYLKVVDMGRKYLETISSRQKPEMNRLIANAYFQMKNYRQALPFFETYENLTRKQISAQESYRIGYTLFKNQKFQEAVPEFQQATAGDESLAQNAWYHLADCYEQTGQPRFAQNAYVKAYEINADVRLSQDALLAYARISVQQKGDPARNAIALVQQFVNNVHYDPSARQQASSLLVRLYLNSHNELAALSAIEKAGIIGNTMIRIYQQLAYSQGVMLVRQNNFRQALTFLNKALKYTPDAAIRLKSLYWKADAYYRLGQLPQASRAYRIFLTSPGASSSALYARANYDLAYCYFNRKDYQQALLFFKRFLAKKSGDSRLKADAGLRIADAYLAQSDFSNAEKWYDRVLKTGGRNAAYALYQKAYLFGAQGEFQQKVQALLALINSYPQSVMYNQALYDVASTFNSALNDQRRAIVYFQRLVKEHPTSDYARKARVKMGLLYYKNNQYDRAIVVLKKVIASYPASQEAAVALSTLQSIYKDEGRLSDYFAYAKTLDFVQVSISEEDSLTFSVGEDAYLAGNCSRVISALNNYLQKFKKGGFVLKANHYLSDCYARKKDTALALIYYRKIINYPLNEYSRSALLKAAQMEFARHLYDQSAKHYKKLNTISENSGLKLKALDGAMRSDFLQGRLHEAQQTAHILLKTPGVNDEQLIFAHYVLAKSALASGGLKIAFREFNIVSKLDKGKLGAESKFEKANILFGNKKYDETEKQVYALSDQFPNQLYWVARGFILLADVYVARGNVFQARETLKSVITNYPGEDLKNMARKKLQKLPAVNSISKKKPDSAKIRK